jgi:hypothetical protein
LNRCKSNAGSVVAAIRSAVTPDWISVVGANTFLIAAGILFLEAIREFRGTLPRVWQAHCAGALAILAITYTGGMLTIWTLIQIAGAIYFYFATPSSSLLSPSWINGVFVIGASLGVVCCSFGFILMTDERAMIDLEETTNRSIRANRELAEAVERVNSATQRAAASDAAKRVTDDVLDLSKIEAGRLAMESYDFDLSR